MKHLVMFSGGLGSWMAGKIVVERYGVEDVELIFADTKIEDEDLYRFLEEGAENIGAPLVTIAEGRTPWEVFHDTRFLGNSRVGNCSRVLKREFIRKWIKERYEPDECVMYLGIDGMEAQRQERAAEWWKPYRVESPLCEPPFVSYGQIKDRLATEGIEIPRLYKLGFAHNNCGGFCVRSGQGQFAHLLKVMPGRYAYHEAKEQELREYLGADVTILRRQEKNVRIKMTLTEFRKRTQGDGDDSQLELLDWGGCSCLVGDL
jgi:3'-phosphoadenosine 5'-phosphosulfate sulfotransferase (PAPS reductase)/FAD synthetase